MDIETVLLSTVLTVVIMVLLYTYYIIPKIANVMIERVRLWGEETINDVEKRIKDNISENIGVLGDSVDEKINDGIEHAANMARGIIGGNSKGITRAKAFLLDSLDNPNISDLLVEKFGTYVAQKTIEWYNQTQTKVNISQSDTGNTNKIDVSKW